MDTRPTTSEEPTLEETTPEEPTSKKTESDARKEWLGQRIIRILNSGDIIYRDYLDGETEIIEKVKDLLKGRELSKETYEAVNDFLDRMKTKIKTDKFVFQIHDTIPRIFSNTSPERCDNIDYFLSLIRGLVEYINDPPTQKVGFEYKPLFTHTAEIEAGSGFMASNRACNVNVYIKPIKGGSKSRRRHRRPHKSARKTTRKSKSMYKAKSKTHHRRRHSRVRKHKKYTSRRR
jgi:hypothetical protein